MDLSRLLLVSRRWVATLWADGYRHAAALDADGYFEGRRRGGPFAYLVNTAQLFLGMHICGSAAR